ncbi:hypothetical protein HK101_009093 [Irineochytrium annulatum]|nr:hypothetical protein HK101_009093 [Irineochytrium annulatum]
MESAIGSKPSHPALVPRLTSVAVDNPDQVGERAPLPVIVLDTPTNDQMGWSKAQLVARTRDVIEEAIRVGCPDVSRERIIYAVAGLCMCGAFTPLTKPVLSDDDDDDAGGKTNPGFRDFIGSTAADLLDWLLDRAVSAPLGGRGRKKLDAGLALRFLVACVNRVIELESLPDNGGKDDVDESLLRGLDWTGQVVRGKIVIPRHLRSKDLLTAAVLAGEKDEEDDRPVGPAGTWDAWGRRASGGMGGHAGYGQMPIPRQSRNNDYHMARAGSGEVDEFESRRSLDSSSSGDTGSGEGFANTWGDARAGIRTGSPVRMSAGGRNKAAAAAVSTSGESGNSNGWKSRSPPGAHEKQDGTVDILHAAVNGVSRGTGSGGAVMPSAGRYILY